MKPTEVTSLDLACELGLVSHVTASTLCIANTKRALPEVVKTWMLFSEIVYYTSSKNTWTSLGQRILVNKHRTDMSIALSDNIHGFAPNRLDQEIEAFNYEEVLSSAKILIENQPDIIPVLLTTQWSLSNIYHLIYDCLAKLSIAERMYERKRIKVLVPENTILMDLLDLFGYRYQVYKQNYFVKGNIGIVSMPHFTGNIPIDTRIYLAQVSSSIQPGDTRAIYISRKVGRHRSILNEDEMLMRIQSIFKIESVRLERLSLVDQIRLMKGVSIVIAPHGAGLSWLGFNSHPCHLFEIFSSDYINDCFEGACATGSMRYKYIENDTCQAGGFMVNIEALAVELAEFISGIS